MAAVPVELPPLVDRQEEVARIAEALDAAERGEGRLLLLRGEAGCGKTRLAQEAAVQAQRRAFATGFGTALSESVVPYHPWREALDGLGLGRILEENPPPRLLGLYVLVSEDGITAKVERDGKGPPPSAVAAARAYVSGTRAPEAEVTEEGRLSFLSLGSHRAIIHRGDGFQILAIVEGREDEAFLSDVRGITRELESSPGESRVVGKAKVGPGTSAEAVLRRFLEMGKYEGIDHVRGDPKLRQARLFEQVALGLSRKSEASPQLVAVDDLQWANPLSLALLQYVARNTREDRVLLVGAYRVEEAGLRPHLKDALAKLEQDRQPAGLLVSGLPREEMRRLAEVFLGPHALPSEFLDLLWRETQGYPLFIREVLRGLQDDGAIRARAGVKRLDRRMELLAIPARVREAIRIRLERLPKGERRLLDAAAACGTRFTASLLAKVAGGDEAGVLSDLISLVRVHGLLRQTEDGFAFDHPAVQEVAYEALPADTRHAHHIAAAQWLELVGGPVEDVAEHYYRARDPHAVPKLIEAAAESVARYGNVEAIRLYEEALELPLSPSETRTVFEGLAAAYDTTGERDRALAIFRKGLETVLGAKDRAFLLARTALVHVEKGEFEPASREGKAALSLVESEDCQEKALALFALGEAARGTGRSTDAFDFHAGALAMRERVADQEGILASLNHLGILHRHRGELDKALECYRKCLAIASDKVGGEARVARALHNIGNVYSDQGRLDEALDFYKRATGISERLGHLKYLSNSFECIGLVHINLGRLAEGTECLRRSLLIRERLGDRPDVGKALHNLGVAYEAAGDYGQAFTSYNRAAEISEEIGDMSNLPFALAGIGNVLRYQSDYAGALKYHQRALVISRGVQSKRREAFCYLEIGRDFARLGDYLQALKHFDGALAICEDAGFAPEMAETLIARARVCVEVADILNARRDGTEALRIARETGNKRAIAEAEGVMGTVLREEGEWTESAQLFKSSIATLNEIGFPLEKGRSKYELGLMWVRAGQPARAKAELEEASRLFAALKLAGEESKVRRLLEQIEPPVHPQGPHPL